MEEIVAEATRAFAIDGEVGLAAVCSRVPEHASRIREIVTRLARIGTTGADSIPERLGDFRLIRRLGAGGMGVVFEAEQVSLARRVAVKIVRPELLYFEGARERFRREVEAVARLHHPAIVPILQSGEEDGVPFYAMELVDGASFEQVTTRLAGRDPARATGNDLRIAVGGELTASDPFAGSYWETCVRLFLSVCDGISHVHRRGIVHRDLKPSNIMLTTDGRTMVLDFGLAHVADEARLTRSGSQPGSPAYMAPEQLRGGPADERADIYSLAASLHQALALAPPFPIDDLELLRRRILEGRPRPLRDANRAVPRELVLVLRQAMDPDSARRYRTMADFSADLQAVLAHRPIRARRLSLLLRGKRFLQRHPTASVGSAGLAVLAMALPAALLWQETRANEVLSVERDRAANSYGIALDAIDEMLLRVGSDRLRHLPDAQQAGIELVERALEYFDRLAEQNPGDASLALYRLRARSHLAPMQLALGRADEAVATAHEAIDGLGGEDLAAPATWRIMRATLWRTIAEASARRMNPTGVEQAAQRILADLAGVQREDVPDPGSVPDHLAYAEACLADAAAMRGNSGDEEAHLRRAIEFSRSAAEQAGSPATALGSTIEHLCNLAAFLRRGERLEEAAAVIAQAEPLLAESRGGDPRPWRSTMLTARVADERAQIWFGMAEWEQAENEFRLALAARERWVADYPDLVQPRRLLGGTRNNFARLLLGRDRMAEAAELLRLAVRDQDWVLARDPSDRDATRYLANHLQSLAFALRELQLWEELVGVAERQGTLQGSAAAARGAARNLLRCAEQLAPSVQPRLRARALEFLLEAERRGWGSGSGSLDDALYDPLRAVPEFQALRERVEAL